MSCTQSTFFSFWVLGSGTRASRMLGMHYPCELPSQTHNPFRCFDIRPELFHFSTRRQLTLPVHPQLTLKSPPSPKVCYTSFSNNLPPSLCFSFFLGLFPLKFSSFKGDWLCPFPPLTNIRLNPTKGMTSTVKRKKSKYTSQL